MGCGLAKTRIVNFLGIILGLETKRVQFTPDLMPGDILGTEILDEMNKNDNYFNLLKVLCCQLLLADEINRQVQRTQSALLQAMQEKSNNSRKRLSITQAFSCPCNTKSNDQRVPRFLRHN